MLIPLIPYATSSVTHPSSENLLTLIIITGGLLFICLLLLVIVMLRAKARRKKLNMSGDLEIPKEKILNDDKLKTAVVEVSIKKEDLSTITQPDQIRKDEVKPIVEVKKEEIKPVVEVKKEIVPVIETKIPEVKKEIVPVIETKIPEVKKEEPKKEEVKPPVVVTQKPYEVIIKTEGSKEVNKPDENVFKTSMEEKQQHFKKVLNETHSKEDNLKILQERLAELGKEKKTVVTFKEEEKKEETKPEIKKEPVENVKLVDLTALINEKLKAKSEKTEPVVPIVKKEEPKLEEKKEEPKILAEEESHKIMTPFIDKINEKHPDGYRDDERPEKIIEKIQEEINTVAEKEPEKPIVEKTTPSVTQQTQNTNEPPKTFTEWLSTLKK